MNEEFTESEVMALIAGYLSLVNLACERLRDRFATFNLMQAVNARTIPRDGTVGDMTYSFHGVGCAVELDGTLVDFDFGPDERCDGFDAWRLFLMAQSDPRWRHLADRSRLEAALERLLRRGNIVAPRWLPSEHLYYLRSAVQEGHNGHAAN